MQIDIIAGARPNFIKIASIINAIDEARANGKNIEYRLVHTGQHYGHEMSDRFFTDLNIPQPHINLGVGSGTSATQAGAMMMGYEKLLEQSRPDLTLVVGDVTSTMACALAAKKMHVTVAHVEAGLRSFDMKMPEEVNRIVTDSISDYFFTTSRNAVKNLLSAGTNEDNIYFVGNTMIDTFLRFESKFVQPSIWPDLQLNNRNYIVLTLHRPDNVDDADKLLDIVNNVVANANGVPVVFPVHPRTAAILEASSVASALNLYVCKPLGYLEFNYLVKNALMVITDSGGVSEETTIMNVPCLTMRSNTERPETVAVGTNELVGSDTALLAYCMQQVFEGNWKTATPPELWDGQAGKRIVNTLYDLLLGIAPQKQQHEQFLS